MLKKETVENIIKDLKETNIPLVELANKYNTSRGTINNINNGLTHKNKDFTYPLRNKNIVLTINEIAFIKQLSSILNTKQIHLVLGKASYPTINSALKSNCAAIYSPEEELEDRLNTFLLMLQPKQELINQFSYTLTLEDLNYIQLLGRLGADLNEVAYAFLELIEFETSLGKIAVSTKEDLDKYIAWGGNKSQTMWWIKNVYSRRVRRYRDKEISYLNVDPNIFKQAYPDIDTNIVKSIIDFSSKENY